MDSKERGMLVVGLAALFVAAGKVSSPGRTRDNGIDNALDEAERLVTAAIARGHLPGGAP